MDLIRVNEKNEIEVLENVITEIKNFEALKVKIEIEEKKLREELLEAMKKYNITNWETPDGSIKAVYKSASTRKTIDSKRLKEELPDIAEEYSKISDVKESIALSIEV
jgi:predicted phage-related endonuclease